MSFQHVVEEHAKVVALAATELGAVLDEIVGVCKECVEQGRKVLACGNGGSASDAQHLIAELVGRFSLKRRALPGFVLAGDQSTLTALANDFGYDHVFARHLDATAHNGDVLFALSTSGNSPNVVKAAEVARLRGCTVVAFTGADGGALAWHSHLLVRAPSTVVARVQEVHGLCIHYIAHALDRLFKEHDS